MTAMTHRKAIRLGFSADKRRRRREHRLAARYLREQGGGSILASVAAWHANQARWVGR